MVTEANNRRTARPGVLVAVLALALLALLLGGCTATAANLQGLTAPAAQAPAPRAVSEVVAPLSDYVLPGALGTPTPTPAETEEAKQFVTVSSQVRANLRSGAGTNFDIVAKINPGGSLEVLGRSQDNRWYQVAVPEGVGGTAKEAWISADLVRTGGSAANVPVAASGEVLLNDDLQAEWNVDWSCNSERCQVKQCTADVTAAVNRPVAAGFLPVEHNVTWADQCFNTDAWTFEVNQSTGAEKNGEADDNFLYGYWLGANPGDANGVFPLDDDRGVMVYCSGPHKVEIEEGGGWTTVYEGNTCHDVKTGMLVFMDYTKRWLYTGDFEGKTYERAYFGDSEKLEQRLVETTAPLEFVTKK